MNSESEVEVGKTAKSNCPECGQYKSVCPKRLPIIDNQYLKNLGDI